MVRVGRTTRSIPGILALLVMTLAEHFPGADVLKAMKMVLIHDLVEIDAGDTFLYDDQANLDKSEREQAAAERIFGLLPQDQADSFRALWQEFEAKESAEAIFAASIDRLAPITLNICTEGRLWRENQVTASQVAAHNWLILERAPAVIADYVRARLTEAAAGHFFYEENAGGTPQDRQQT